MEVLAVNLRSHPDIVGLALPGVQPPLPVVSLYADDTSAIVSSDPGITAVFETYDRFERASGSRLNLGKCKGLWLGSWRGRVDSPVAIDWSGQMIKVLGVHIGFGDLDEADWRPVLMQCVNALPPGACAPCLSLAGRLLPMPLRFLASGMSPLWSTCQIGYLKNSTLYCLTFSGQERRTKSVGRLLSNPKSAVASL